MTYDVQDQRIAETITGIKVAFSDGTQKTKRQQRRKNWEDRSYIWTSKKVSIWRSCSLLLRGTLKPS